MLLLYRYMLGDLLRVGVLATGVLVTVTAMGAAIKPLANDDLLSATQTVRYMMLAIVPMLQFSLPFAFGFAATLSMHRLAAENEILAMSVTGISYWRILAPIAVLGLVLTVVMVMLTQTLVPRFWSLMQQTLADDLTELFEASIRRGTPFQLGDIQIFADRLLVVENPPDTDVDTRFILFNAVAAEVDKSAGIVSDVAARQLVADLYRKGHRRILMLAMTDAMTYNGRTGELAGAPSVKLQRAIELPDAIRHNLSYLSRAELVHLLDHPEDFPRVRRIMDQLAAALREQAAWDEMGRRLAAGQSVELRTGDQRRFVVSGDALVNGVITARGGESVRVEEFQGDTLIRWFQALQVKLSTAGGDLQGPLTFEAELSDAIVSVPREEHGNNERALRVLERLTYQEADRLDWASMDSRQLLERASGAGPNSEVAQQASRLRHRLDSMKLEIANQMSRRYAQSVMAPLLLLLGAALTMWRRHSLPLTIYLWAFGPAIVDVVVMSGGGPVIENGDVVLGHSLIWSGNALLAFLIVVVLSRLVRN